MTTTSGDARAAVGPTTEDVWRALAKASFAVISHVTSAGDPRSSGVLYKAEGRRLYVVTDPAGWKARQIAADGRVSVTVPVRRGGILSLLFPIPPATITMHGTATVHRGDAPEIQSRTEVLAALVPPELRSSSAVIEIAPEGTFVTYGIGVPLLKMRDRDVARGRVPVAS